MHDNAARDPKILLNAWSKLAYLVFKIDHKQNIVERTFGCNYFVQKPNIYLFHIGYKNMTGATMFLNTRLGRNSTKVGMTRRQNKMRAVCTSFLDHK